MPLQIRVAVYREAMEESGRSPQGEQVIRVSLDKTVQQFLGLKLTTKKFHGIAGIYDLTTIVHDQNILLIHLLLYHLLLSHPFFSVPLVVFLCDFDYHGNTVVAMELTISPIIPFLLQAFTSTSWWKRA